MTRKGLMEGLPENLLDLEYPCPIFLLTKETKIPIGPKTDVMNSPPEFMLQMYSAFFNVKRIRGFTSTFVAICSATSHPFVFTYRNKSPPLYILKLLVTSLRNQDKKVALIQVDEDGSLARYSKLMKT